MAQVNITLTREEVLQVLTGDRKNSENLNSYGS